jgi:ankyrin repeat protein
VTAGCALLEPIPLASGAPARHDRHRWATTIRGTTEPTGMNRAIHACVATFWIPLLPVAMALATQHVPKQQAPQQRERDTPFHNAENGKLAALKKQLAKDPKVLHKFHITGMTVLHYAAMGNQPEVIRYLVKQGAKVDQLDETGSRTPLFWAAMSQKAYAGEAGRVLIELGANVKWRAGGKKSTTSVLDRAAAGGHAGLVKLLLKKGASPFTRYYVRFNRKRHLILVTTSLHRACQGPLAALYVVPPEFASRKYPSLLSEYEDNHKVIELLAPVLKDINIRDSKGRTPLHIAASYGHPKIAGYLLKKYPKVEINAKDNRSNTPLHLAVKGAADFVRRSPKRNADDRLETIKVLLKHKPNLTIKNNAGQTARDLARATGNKAIMALFP